MRNRLAVFLCLCVSLVYGQSKGQDTIYLDITTTVHMIFKSTVIKADVGSGQYVDSSGNVMSDIATEQSDVRLKLAPNVQNFAPTNLFVETLDGYYSYMLVYKRNPGKYVYAIDPTSAISLKTYNDDTNTSSMGSVRGSIPAGTGNSSVIPNSPGNGKLVSSGIRAPMKGDDKNIPDLSIKLTKDSGDVVAGRSDQKMDFWVDGIFVNNQLGKVFFRMNVKNDGNIVYNWGYTGFFVRNKGNKSLKNEAVQEEEIEPVYIHNEAKVDVLGREHAVKVYVFDKFTIADKKVLSIEFWENNGDRKVIIELTAKELLNASLVN